MTPDWQPDTKDERSADRDFSFPGEIENTSQPDAGASSPRPPRPGGRGGDRPHDHTLPTDPLAHTQKTERESFLTSPIGGLAARFWPAAQLKPGPAPAAAAFKTAAGRLGHRTGMPAAPDADAPASAAASGRQRSCKGSAMVLARPSSRICIYFVVAFCFQRHTPPQLDLNVRRVSAPLASLRTFESRVF